MEEKKETIVTPSFKPDWHPSLSSLLGDLRGQYCYINRYGTVTLLGAINEKLDISKYATESDINGPVYSIAAGSNEGVLP